MCVGLQNVRGWFGFQGFPGSRSVLFGAGGGGEGKDPPCRDTRDTAHGHSPVLPLLPSVPRNCPSAVGLIRVEGFFSVFPYLLSQRGLAKGTTSEMKPSLFAGMFQAFSVCCFAMAACFSF